MRSSRDVDMSQIFLALETISSRLLSEHSNNQSVMCGHTAGCHDLNFSTLCMSQMCIGLFTATASHRNLGPLQGFEVLLERLSWISLS